MEKKMKHLEMIQSIVSRMANNSFLLKGWAVTLAAGIFALSNRDANGLFFLVAYVPIIVFWLLDSYYLKQERLYRALYNDVCKLEEKDIDFSMNTDNVVSESCEYSNCLFSKTELAFYLPLALLCAGIIILVSCF